MTALDTNILVYAHRPESPFHDRAREVVRGLAEGSEPWAIAWPSIHEFLSIVTHSRIFVEPTAVVDALGQVALWTSSPTLELLSETDRYLPVLQVLLANSLVTGPKVHDARIVALCIAHGVERLFSADRDFSRFGSVLEIVNPL